MPGLRNGDFGGGPEKSSLVAQALTLLGQSGQMKLCPWFFCVENRLSGTVHRTAKKVCRWGKLNAGFQEEADHNCLGPADSILSGFLDLGVMREGEVGVDEKLGRLEARDCCVAILKRGRDDGPCGSVIRRDHRKIGKIWRLIRDLYRIGGCDQGLASRCVKGRKFAAGLAVGEEAWHTALFKEACDACRVDHCGMSLRVHSYHLVALISGTVSAGQCRPRGPRSHYQ